ncbi:MAG: coproporphyrinogen III oxidase, partial [Pseudomonadota bacterium]
MDNLAPRKNTAKLWFEDLRDTLVTAFEKMEAKADPALYGEGSPSRFTLKPWTRGDDTDHDQGGGTMGMLRGRVFEKAGIHTSTVYGTFSEEFAKMIPGAEEDPRFWASGISLIAHPRNPHVPAVHMNTRMIVTQKCWFGGGGDLNPMMDQYRHPHHPDTAAFHAPYQKACDQHDPA